MKQTLQRGFTLIELLVVIAIIGILSSVVLASLNSARNSAQVAAAKSELSSMRAEAEIEYNISSQSYDEVCTTGSEKADGGNGCYDGADAWAASIVIDDTSGAEKYFCVDSTGFAGERSTALGTSEVVCPAS
jgi:prepilin-type N-terminal cleavage/methylation domain-containing protein